MTEREKQYREELFKLMQENPDLPIAPMVDADIVEDDCGYWLGAWGRASVDEYLFAERSEKMLFKSDDEYYRRFEYDIQKFTDEELVAEINRRAAEPGLFCKIGFEVKAIVKKR